MEKSFNTNTKVFSDGMQMLEAQNAVLRRVIDDLRGYGPQGDGIKLIEHVPGGYTKRIDFNAYLKEYIEELVASEGKAKEEGPRLVTPDEDSPIIFGGDTAP